MNRDQRAEVRGKVWQGKIFDARCLICGREFQHDGTRVTCSDECRLRKLRGVKVTTE